MSHTTNISSDECVQRHFGMRNVDKLLNQLEFSVLVLQNASIEFGIHIIQSKLSRSLLLRIMTSSRHTITGISHQMRSAVTSG